MIKRQKQVLNVTVSEEIPSLDTAKTMDGTSAHIMQNIFEGLYALDDKDQPIPAVAKSFKRSEDGKNIHSICVKMQNGQMGTM